MPQSRPACPSGNALAPYFCVVLDSNSKQSGRKRGTCARQVLWPSASRPSHRQQSRHRQREASSRLVLARANLYAGRLAKAEGLGAKSLAVILFDFLEIAHARAGKAYKLPADHTGVSPVNRITEHAFDRVLAEEGKEQARFDFAQSFVLRGRGEVMKEIGRAHV